MRSQPERDLPTTMTGGHRKLHALLEAMDYVVEDEHSAPPYSIDCYLPEVNVGVEYDGKPFHSGGVKQAKDSLRDRTILEEYGIPIIRTSAIDLQVKNLDSTREALRLFIEEHGQT